jgi:hypothetical protein
VEASAARITTNYTHTATKSIPGGGGPRARRRPALSRRRRRPARQIFRRLLRRLHQSLLQSPRRRTPIPSPLRTSTATGASHTTVGRATRGETRSLDERRRHRNAAPLQSGDATRPPPLQPGGENALLPDGNTTSRRCLKRRGDTGANGARIKQPLSGLHKSKTQIVHSVNR